MCCFWAPSPSARSSGGPRAAPCRVRGGAVLPGRGRRGIHLPKDRTAGMMYSPGPMNGKQRANADRLEERLAELEKLVEELDGAPDPEVVVIFDRAVALLAEVNARLEAGLLEAEGEARELGDLLEEVDFGPFDAALEDLERPSEGSGGS